MKFIDEVDIELVNQELNFHTQDNNLVIRGGCDLFTTKPMSADRKLFKTIDKHLDQILEDSQLSQSIERERQHSINSLFGSSVSPPPSNPGTRRGSYAFERERRNSASLINFRRGSILNGNNVTNSNISKSFNERSGSFDTSVDESTIDESPFGPLKNVATRKTFSYLIAILNSTYPDHDFSNLQPSTENFHKLSSPDELIRKFNNLMISLGKKEDLLNWVWDIVNQYMDLIPSNSNNPANVSRSRHNSTNGINSTSYTPLSPAESPPNLNSNFDGCQIYEFQPTDQSILEDLNYPYQAMWSYFWFIYNKKKKRVTFLYLTGVNKIHYSQVNGGRSSSFSRRRKLRRAEGTSKGEISDDDEVELIDVDYMDEEVFIDDDIDDDDIMEDNDVVGDLEI